MVQPSPFYSSTQLEYIYFSHFSDILNIATVTTFAVQHRFTDGFTNGEAFWMTICSTIISTITNLTLIWDLVKTPNFDKAGTFPIALFVLNHALTPLPRQRHHPQAKISCHYHNHLLDLHRNRRAN